MLLDLTIEEDSKKAALKTEIERKNFSRAVDLAASLNLSNEEIEILRHKSLCQMAGTYRNAFGTKILAQKYGYSKQDVKRILEEHASVIGQNGKRKPLKVCYDSFYGKYFSYEDWISHLIEKWHKL